MAIFGSFGHCLPNILHAWPHDSFQVIRLSMTLGWAYFKVIGLFHIKFLKNGVWYGKSYYRLLTGNHTLAFDWCYFWWPWSTFEGHFSLGCLFHVHFSYPWHAFASHGLPAIAELLVYLLIYLCLQNETLIIYTPTASMRPWHRHDLYRRNVLDRLQVKVTSQHQAHINSFLLYIAD